MVKNYLSCMHLQPFCVTLCGILVAGELNTKNVQDVLKLNWCLFTAIVIGELEILIWVYNVTVKHTKFH